MSEEKFQDASALEAWLKGKDVDPEKAAEVSQALFDHGYNLPSTLIGISFEELTGYGISNPVARHLTNKLKEAAPQQQNGKLRFLNSFLYSNVASNTKMIRSCCILVLVRSSAACHVVITYYSCIRMLVLTRTPTHHLRCLSSAAFACAAAGSFQ
jgi:hypothetical protein